MKWALMFFGALDVDVHDHIQPESDLALEAGDGSAVKILIDLCPLHKVPVVDHFLESLFADKMVLHAVLSCPLGGRLV